MESISKQRKDTGFITNIEEFSLKRPIIPFRSHIFSTRKTHSKKQTNCPLVTFSALPHTQLNKKYYNSKVNKVISQMNLTINDDLEESQYKGLTNASSSYFKRMRHLKALVIDSKGCTKLCPESYSNLMRSIRNLKSINSLKLNLEGCHQLNDLTLLHIKHSIGSLRKLAQVSFNFNGCSSISDKGLQFYSRTISNISELISFDLNLKDLENLTSISLDWLRRGIKNHQALNKFKLNLAGCWKINNQGMEALKNTLLNLPSLTKLSTNFDNCLQLSKQEGFNSLAQGIQNLNKLSSFKMSLNNTRLGRNGFWSLSNGFSNLTQIKKISLSLAQPDNINNINLSFLGDAISRMRLLEKFNCQFIDCEKLTDEGILAFAFARFSLLKRLKKIQLGFHNCNSIEASSLQFLFKDINKSIQHLELEFKNCDKISDESIFFIAPIFNELPSLDTLALSLIRCKKVSNIGFQILTKIQNSSIKKLKLCYEKKNQDDSIYKMDEDSFMSLPSLTSLELNVDNILREVNYMKSVLSCLKNLKFLNLNFDCKNTDEIQAIKESIPKMTKLEEFSLSLNCMVDICKSSMNSIIVPLKFPSLKKLSLGFQANPKCTDQILEDLGSKIKRMKALEAFNFSILNCRMISKKGIKYLKKQIEDSPIKQLDLKIAACEKIYREDISKIFLNSKMKYSLDFEK